MNRQPTTDQVQGLPDVATPGVVNHSVTFVDPTTGVHTQQSSPTGGELRKSKEDVRMPATLLFG